MRDQTLDWIARDTDLARRLASLLFGLGGFLLLVGGIGLMARSVIEHATGRPMALGELLAGLPVWWIPESLPGLALAIALLAAGRWIDRAAADLERVSF